MTMGDGSEMNTGWTHPGPLMNTSWATNPDHFGAISPTNFYQSFICSPSITILCVELVELLLIYASR